MSKESIFSSLAELVNAGFEVRLNKNSISVIEHYKSDSREKYLEKEVGGSCGLDYFTDGCLHITDMNLKKQVQSLLKHEASDV